MLNTQSRRMPSRLAIQSMGRAPVLEFYTCVVRLGCIVRSDKA